MAKQGVNIAELSSSLISDARKGVFKPVYLLMGDEPYYPDLVCNAIMENAVDEGSRDFDQFVFYGSDTDIDTIITACRSYSMFGGNVLVVVKEAQLLSKIEELSVYLENPLESTILVVLLHKATVDKRKTFYKLSQKIGVVVDSVPVRDYEITNWIISYYKSKGLSIEPGAAALLGESAGTDLGTITVETDKLLKNLPEGTTSVTIADIEKNVGISRQFSVFELTKELSYKNAAKAVNIATHIGSAAKFAMPMAVSALFMHFYRILKYEALLMGNPRPDSETKARVLGVSPYFFRDYDAAVSNYPLKSCFAVISLLNDYDFKGKGGDVGSTTEQGSLLVELVTKILNI